MPDDAPFSRPTSFESGGARLRGDLRLPEPRTDGAPFPIVVLAHGIGGTRAMRLDAYARRFAAAGIAAMTFDYRGFGDSGGTPRRIIDVAMQLADWRSAIAHARAIPEIDPARIALWGSSFGGGHVLQLAADGERVAAVVAQGPFTDGLASSTTLGVRSTLRVALPAIADTWAGLRGKEPVTIAAAGPPGTAALMTAPDAAPGYRALAAYAGEDPDEPVAARLGLRIGFYRPGAHLGKIAVPALIQVCKPDSVAPHRATLRHIRRAANPLITPVTYDRGHFDIYFGEAFEELVTDQVDFLREVLAVSG